MNIYSYIPQSKDDFERIEQLRQLEADQMIPLIPQLLEWLQDANWPIFSDVKSILIPQQMHLTEPLRAILRSTDSSWKYFIVSDFLPCLNDDVVQQLQTELRELAYAPSAQDRLEEVDDCARRLLEARSR